MSWLDLRREGNVLIDFFCEDKDTFKLDECFRIFQDFCQKFQKAVKVKKIMIFHRMKDRFLPASVKFSENALLKMTVV